MFCEGQCLYNTKAHLNNLIFGTRNNNICPKTIITIEELYTKTA